MNTRDLIRFIVYLTIFFVIDMLFFAAFSFERSSSEDLTMAAMCVIVAAIREDRK